MSVRYGRLCKAIRSARVFREKGAWSSVRSSLGSVSVLAHCADRGLWEVGGNAGGVGGEGLLKLLHDGGRSVKYRRSTSEPAATFGASPLMAADDARSPARGGEIAAGGTEVQTSMQHPLMTVHVGGNDRVDGERVLDGIGEVLIALMPAVPLDDPFRPALEALACAAGRPLPVGRVRLAAV
jgi:hypothetical protein